MLKNACIRFSRVFGQLRQNGSEFCCAKCKTYFCQDKCLKDTDELIVFDFGSKTTWFKYESENTAQLSRHPTIQPLHDDFGSRNTLNDELMNCPVCKKNKEGRSRNAAKYTGVENPSHHTHRMDRKRFVVPFSMNSFRNFHCLDSSQNEMDDSEYMCASLLGQGDESGPQDACSSDAPLHESSQEKEAKSNKDEEKNNGDQSNLSSSTTLCFLMKHMIRRNSFQHRKNIAFVICEPFGLSRELKASLTCYAFNELKALGVCYIHKAVAISLYVGEDTCLIIDSGANQTTITPILNQKHLTVGVISKPIGGIHVTRWLKNCIQMKLHSSTDFEIDLDGLDASPLLRECWVAYNPGIESKRKLANKTIPVKAKRNGIGEYHDVELSHELYLAVEDMYTQLNLPAMVAESIAPFDDETKRQLLSKIVLSGGNSRLYGLGNRLTRDLQNTCVAHASAIHVCDPRLVFGRMDAVEGASYIRRYEHEKWMTRGHYIFNGA